MGCAASKETGDSWALRQAAPTEASLDEKLNGNSADTELQPKEADSVQGQAAAALRETSSGSSSSSTTRNGSNVSAVCSSPDPLLEVVWRAMQSKPSFGSPAEPSSGPGAHVGATEAPPKHAQHASQAQQEGLAQQGQNGDSSSAQPRASVSGQSISSNGSGGSSTAIGRRSAGSLTVNVRWAWQPASNWLSVSAP
jgi:hypothetical protein